MTRPSRALVSVFIDLPGEVWIAIQFMPGYDVSNLGRVRSWRSSHGATRPVPKLRKLLPDSDGYLQISFIHEGKLVVRKVHHLVLETFKEPKPPGLEARHLDRDPTHNTPDNLEWGTHVENIEDQRRHGTDTRGERNGASKLTSAQAHEIRESPEKGSILAVRHGVSEATICRVRKGLRYAGETIL